MLPSCGKRRERAGDEEDHKEMIIMEKSVIHPLMAAIDGKGSSLKAGRAKLGRVESIHKERERRGKMAEMFSVLQSIVPNIFPKATRENIVTETIQYIQRLQEERDRLETLKKSQESTAVMPTLTQCTNRRDSAVNVTVSGNGVVFFGIRTATNHRHSAVEILGVFERHEAEVLAASVSVNGQQRRMDLTVTAFVGGNEDVVEKIKRELLNL
ncbi:hypothetical protein RHSIM_Rhsim02G0012900 [Rhododendron simsii]|uniref:BHLH domain-containing protein n=1 Tax=Rhododendron simsii TaxID=118357 RepID=A0A834LUQ3_RHOSS|nr:hypothetical protein RHSIM_Rhsim02G0012900 [Rhododendron simsii]